MLQELERLEEKRSQTIEKYKLKCEILCTGCLIGVQHCSVCIFDTEGSA